MQPVADLPVTAEGRTGTGAGLGETQTWGNVLWDSCRVVLLGI